MRIAISSTQCNGKSFFLESFLKRWPMYETPEETYRDLIKKKNLKLNTEGDIDSQTIIRDALTDQAMQNSDKEFCVHDRCILDNLIYTLWLAEKDKIDDDEFIANSFHITRETLKMYDIIFFLPIHQKSPVTLEEKENRNIELKYRQEINNIFLGVFNSYKEKEGLIFPLENSPAMIEIYGDEMELEKTNMVADYLNKDGAFKETDESLMQTIGEMAQNETIAKALLDQVSK